MPLEEKPAGPPMGELAELEQLAATPAEMPQATESPKAEAPAPEANATIVRQKKPTTRLEKAFALKASGGNIDAAADALGIFSETFDEAIKRDPNLQALLTDLRSGGDGAAILSEMESMRKDARDIPDGPPPAVDIVDLIDDNEKKMLSDGLLKLGASAAIVNKLNLLDGLATSSGHFIAHALQKTHKLYFIQLVNLADEADHLKKLLDDDLAQTDPAKKMTNFDRAQYQRAYVDMVKEFGRGYSLNLQGAEAMVNMIFKGNPSPNGVAKRPGGRRAGWGSAKSVK